MNSDSVISRLTIRNNKVMEYDDHTTNDIIETLEKYHPQDRKEYDKISDGFWMGNVKDTAKELFDFLKKNVRYKEEPDSYQTSKSPGVLLHQGYGDCKHYTSFITGVVDSLSRKGYPIDSSTYRFVSDTPDKDVHHVFAIVSGDGKSYWTDPVLSRFDQRPIFYKSQSKKMGGIGAIYRLSGAAVGQMEQMGSHDIKNFIHRHGVRPEQFRNPQHMARFIHSQLLHPEQHLHPHIFDPAHSNLIAGIGKKKAGHKNFLKAIAHGIQVNTANVKHGIDVNAANAKKIALKVSLAAARGPFLTMVDANAFNWAHRLHDTIADPKTRGKALAKWRDIGGKDIGLINAVNNGWRHYKKKHGGYDINRDKIHGIGVVQFAAIAALAATVYAIMKQFMKPAHPGDEKELGDAVQQGTSDLVTQTTDGINSDTPGQPGQGMSITTGVDGSGNPVLQVHDLSHPSILNDNGVAQGAPPQQGGGKTNYEGNQVESSSNNAVVVAPGGDVTTTVATDAEGDINNIFARVKSFARTHKLGLLAAGAALIVLKNKKVKKKLGF